MKALSEFDPALDTPKRSHLTGHAHNVSGVVLFQPVQLTLMRATFRRNGFRGRPCDNPRRVRAWLRHLISASSPRADRLRLHPSKGDSLNDLALEENVYKQYWYDRKASRGHDELPFRAGLSAEKRDTDWQRAHG